MQLNTLETKLGRWLETLPDGLTSAPVILAVSGGSDSLALLHLMHRFSASSGINLSAVTVDHGLRQEAADEARYVKSICNRLQIPHQTLSVDWTGETPGQSKARTKRYRALSEFAHQTGARLILTGHTEDDQAETYLIRKDAQSGWWGLAGMSDLAPLPVWPEGNGLSLGRPLLSDTRAQLRSRLTRLGVQWIDDPSNDNQAFERVRARQRLNEAPELKRQCLDDIARFQIMRTEQADALLRWESDHIQWYPGGSASFCHDAFGELSSDMQFRFFQYLLPCISGLERQPKSDALRQLIDKPGLIQGTLCGCRISEQGEMILITPEITTPDDLKPLDTELIWSGRVRLTRSGPISTPLFVASWSERPVPDRFKAGLDLPFQIRQTLPVLLDEKGIITEIPHLDRVAEIRCSDLVRSRFRRWLNAKTM